jgi:cytochrome o ubiquinol oxidase subunit 2
MTARDTGLREGGATRTRAGLIGVALALLLGGCAGVLDPKGPIGAAEKLILLDSVGIMLVIVVPAIVATLGFAWWFRAGNAHATRRPEFVYSGRLEALVWGVPALIVLFLGSLAWVSSHELDPALPIGKAKPIEVQVVSLDWKWLFIYPAQGVASVNALVLPVGVPVHFRLTSATVMNSFFVPGLGSQIYTMAGMADNLNLLADRPGRYMGLSSHFSGDGFSGMHFTVDAVPQAAFAAWAARARGAGGALDNAAYGRLAVASADVAPTTFSAVRPGLFEEIVRQSAPPPTPRPSHQPDAAHPERIG